jgi:hypothetical protein
MRDYAYVGVFMFVSSSYSCSRCLLFGSLIIRVVLLKLAIERLDLRRNDGLYLLLVAKDEAL